MISICRTEYTFLGAVTEFKYSIEIGRAFNGRNQLKWLKSWGPEWGLLPSQDAFVFVDNHDNQRSGDTDILTYKSRQPYIMANAFMLSHPYGTPRIMSSFKFKTFDQGIHWLKTIVFTHFIILHLTQSHLISFHQFIQNHVLNMKHDVMPLSILSKVLLCKTRNFLICKFLCFHISILIFQFRATGAK